jgi:low temperature requirement protein LtrA
MTPRPAPLRGRDPTESHRASTPLELLFDLTFVVAVSAVAAELAQAVERHRVAAGLVGYLTVFFAIWWAWMSFTWFASAYDCDDVPYRLATLLQMAGVLVLAASVHGAFGQGFTGITVGYVVMRVAALTQWFRVVAAGGPGAVTARRYAAGITVVQVLWVARLALPPALGLASFLLLVLAELAVPVWAERTAQTPWHAEHVTERYSLFTLIVLGESVLAATVAIRSGLDAEGLTLGLAVLSAAGLVLVFALWWLYFLRPFAEGLGRRPYGEYVFGYLHYGVFASLAALGAGLEVAASAVAHHEPGRTAALAVAVPVAVALLLLGGLRLVLGLAERTDLLGTVAAAVLVLAAALLAPSTSSGVALVTLLVVALVARGVRRGSGSRSASGSRDATPVPE